MSRSATTCLTKREQEILSELASGKFYKEIAIECNISINTVKKHCKNIYRKPGVKNKAEAIGKYKLNR